MSSYLLTWNPHKWEWENIGEAIKTINEIGEFIGRWSVSSNKSIKKGDRVFLIRLGKKPKGIVADGYAESDSYEDQHWDEEKNSQGQKTRYIKIRFKNILDAENSPILELPVIKEKISKEMRWSSMKSGIAIPDDVSAKLETKWNEFLMANVPKTYKEDISNLEIKEKINIVCLYFARFKSDDPHYKGKWSKALKKLSEKYNIKYSTLKQNKDAYDANFDNDRKGYHQTPLNKRSKKMYNIYIKYKDIPIEELQKLVEVIINEANQEGHPFYSIKTKSPTQVEAILRKEANIEIDGLNILKKDLKLKQPVFIVLGGDKGKSWVTWETGLIGMCSISQLPYDERYDGNNYKIRIDVKVLLEKPIKREDLKYYSDTYDIIGIGPITKWEPNQAISQIPEKKAVALMRAMLEICPDCEDDLSSIIDEKMMDRVKGAAIKLIPQEVNIGEQLEAEEIVQNQNNNEYDELNDFEDLYNPDINFILDDFIMPKKPIISLKNFINTNKHIIMTGPPGTGKTTLTVRACEEATNKNYISSYMMTTAISDWSTFDTIGGYMPNSDGTLIFEEGIFLKSIRENRWLIIDEINRAEVDKAFGHFFTVLAGQDVELHYKAKTPEGEKNISIRHSNSNGSYYDKNSATYYIGRNWRIISTMNSYDKNSLFMLSYAFMRRFAFVYIPVPGEDDYDKLIKGKLNGQNELSELLISFIKASPKKIGAAIMLDLIAFIEIAGLEGVVDGICSLIVPQYEGITFTQIKKLYKNLGSLLTNDDKELLKVYLCEFFDINVADLSKTLFPEDYDEYNGDDLVVGD